MNEKTLPPYASNLFKRDIYQPGDGEVLGAVRPGSLDALELPSKIGNKMHYRDGRVVDAKRLPADDTEGGAV